MDWAMGWQTTAAGLLFADGVRTNYDRRPADGGGVHRCVRCSALESARFGCNTIGGFSMYVCSARKGEYLAGAPDSRKTNKY